jgi:LCCL domain-containing protein
MIRWQPTTLMLVMTLALAAVASGQALPAIRERGPARRFPAPPVAARPEPDESEPTGLDAPLVQKQPFEARAVEVTLADRSVLRLYLADEIIEIATPHGNLRIPSEDVLRVEFAQRPPAEIAELIAQKLTQLKDDDPDVQKSAGAELVAMGEPAYLPLSQAATGGDPNLAPQAAKVLERLRKSLPRNELATIRASDFIITADIKIAGQIVNPYLKIRTPQFGDLHLKLADARSLRHQSLIGVTEVVQEDVSAHPDPGNLTSFESQQGKVLAFTVTGMAAGGSVWGTDVYTTDSRLAMAAVHAGLLKVGETGVVRLKVIPAPPSFAGSSRHGITTSPYGPYRAAYQFVKGGEEE